MVCSVGWETAVFVPVWVRQPPCARVEVSRPLVLIYVGPGLQWGSDANPPITFFHVTVSLLIHLLCRCHHVRRTSHEEGP